ncbi:hypothetical protein DPMN_127711 [Dreissena polymorpha]|uniref:Secreted protein n=1 Tax=Dreissena polymorpha TaxID=45954 RepID=A0A9D4JZF0_DREPO|nr:hypothetical protein DPMN_127711 [Dreissena polymorpha]
MCLAFGLVNLLGICIKVSKLQGSRPPCLPLQWWVTDESLVVLDAGLQSVDYPSPTSVKDSSATGCCIVLFQEPCLATKS